MRRSSSPGRPTRPRAPLRTCSSLTSSACAQLGDRRRAVQLAREVGDLAVDLQGELLEVARHADRPRLVAEVALELAEDRRDRAAQDRHLALRIESVDRLDQADRGDLDQVVERLLGALIAPRQLAGQRQEALDQLVAGAGLAVAQVADEELAILPSTGAGLVVHECWRGAGGCSTTPEVTNQTPGRWGAEVSSILALGARQRANLMEGSIPPDDRAARGLRLIAADEDPGALQRTSELLASWATRSRRAPPRSARRSR